MATALYSQSFTGLTGNNGWRSTGSPAGPWVPDQFVGGSQAAANGSTMVAGPRPGSNTLIFDHYNIWQQHNNLLGPNDGYVGVHYKLSTPANIDYDRDWKCSNNPGTCGGKLGMGFDSRYNLAAGAGGSGIVVPSTNLTTNGNGTAGGGCKQPGSSGNANEGNSQSISFDNQPRSQTPGLQSNQMVLKTYLYDHTARMQGAVCGQDILLNTPSTPNGVYTGGQTIDVWMFRKHNTSTAGVGNADGHLIYLIDGAVAFDDNQRVFANHADFWLQTFTFYSYVGGSDPAPSTSQLSFIYDDVELWKDFTLAEIQALQSGTPVVNPNQTIPLHYAGNAAYEA